MPTILVVDDHDSIRKGIKLLLETKGKDLQFKVIEASNGKEALSQIASETPDVAVVDLMMPEMDGFSLCNEIKKLHSTVKVVILTAKTDPSTAEKVEHEFVADKFLTKPIDNQVLFNEIHELINQQ